MAVHVEVQNGLSNSFKNLYQTEQEVMLFCSHYTNKYPKPTIHELMQDVDRFSSNLLSKSELIPLHIQCRWLTAIANQPWLIPESCASAEIQVNALLQYMSSNCVWVRSLACSLIRVFCTELNPRGEHIVTQVTISCKNLMTTLEHSLSSDVTQSSALCQVVSCSSLSYVTTYWTMVLPGKAASFVLPTIKSLLNVLEKPRPDVTPFLYQVAADGLSQILHNPSLWQGILTEKDRQETILRHMAILQYFSSPHGRENITLVKLLQTTNMEALLRTMMLSPNIVRVLLVILLNFLQVSTTIDDVPFLEIHWLSLCILWRFLYLVGISPSDNATLLALIRQGTCDTSQATNLTQLVTHKYNEYLALATGIRNEMGEVTDRSLVTSS